MKLLSITSLDFWELSFTTELALYQISYQIYTGDKANSQSKFSLTPSKKLDKYYIIQLRRI